MSKGGALEQPTATFDVDEKHDMLIRDALEFVGERSWAIPSDRFFPELVKYLAETLGVAYAICARVEPWAPTVANTVGFFANGGIAENFSYDLKHTPCQDVAQGEVCVYPNEVQAAFPQDMDFKTMGAVSYVGTQLVATDGKNIIGLVNVIDTKPLQHPDLVRRLLELVAKRAGAELERLIAEERAVAVENRMSDFLLVSSDWFWETGPDLRWKYFSEQFEDVTGVPPGNLIGKTRREVGAPGSDPKAYAQLLDDMDNRRPFRDFEHTRLKSDGTLVYLAISANPAYDKDGNFLGYRGTGRDVSRFHAIESKFRDSMVEAQRAN